MNRRTFIRNAIGSTLTAAAFSRLAWGRLSEMPSGPAADVKDLILFAPYEAFLPEQTDPVLSNPHEGTENGILKAEDIIKGEPLTLEFWHGHGGVKHEFTITAENFSSLKAGNPVVVYVPTNVVGGHYHFVVIDPKRPA